jgi:hypothetical protein
MEALDYSDAKYPLCHQDADQDVIGEATEGGRERRPSGLDPHLGYLRGSGGEPRADE